MDEGRGPRPFRRWTWGGEENAIWRLLERWRGRFSLVAAGVYFYRSYKSGRVSMPMNNRPTVAVMGFKNLGKPDVEWLSNALSEMLSTELGSTDALRTISPENVSTAKVDLALAIVPTFNPATLVRIRRILHSEYVISGAYVAMGSAGERFDSY